MANPVAWFDTTEGSFEAEIYLDRVPITASNFIALCRDGFYDGLHFHRVIAGFMNQFGCPYSRDPNSAMAGKGSPPQVSFPNLKTGSRISRGNGGTIKDENISLDSNLPGTLSMANVGQPNTNGSQFFLNVAHNPSLDWFTPGTSKHPVFGKVTKGMDVVLNISKVRTTAEKPEQPIKMIKITILGAPEPPTKEPAVQLIASSSSSSSSSSRRKKKRRTSRRKRSSSSSSSSSDQVRVLHILSKHKDPTRPTFAGQPVITRSLDDASAFLTQLRQQLIPLAAQKEQTDLNNKFEELARKHSECNSAKRGGDLGSFNREKMQKPFSDAAFSLEVGELSNLVFTLSGVHLILRVK